MSDESSTKITVDMTLEQAREWWAYRIITAWRRGDTPGGYSKFVNERVSFAKAILQRVPALADVIGPCP